MIAVTFMELKRSGRGAEKYLQYLVPNLKEV
jgi:hypothetical protein